MLCSFEMLILPVSWFFPRSPAPYAVASGPCRMFRFGDLWPGAAPLTLARSFISEVNLPRPPPLFNLPSSSTPGAPSPRRPRTPPQRRPGPEPRRNTYRSIDGIKHSKPPPAREAAWTPSCGPGRGRCTTTARTPLDAPRNARRPTKPKTSPVRPPATSAPAEPARGAACNPPYGADALRAHHRHAQSPTRALRDAQNRTRDYANGYGRGGIVDVTAGARDGVAPATSPA